MEVPVVGGLLAMTGAATLLLLLLTGIDAAAHARARRNLEELLAARTHEIAALKANAYDDVSAKLNGMRQELSDLRARLQERVPVA